MKINLNEVIVDSVEKKILSPRNFNRIHLKRLDTGDVNSTEIHEPTLNNTLVYLFSKTFEGTPKGVIVWDWSHDLSHIEQLLSGEVLHLEQFDVENLATTIGIGIEIWLDKYVAPFEP
ncbi:hypothetical protein ACTHQ2_23395 [Bacillus subtilis]